MSINISIRDVVKKYGDVTVIEGMSLEIRESEFFTLLGPSGCGKTTLLRMIAGFNSIQGGDIYFNEKRINDVDPAKRRIGMVFQNYAIFPHLSVRKNVEFGLKNANVSRGEIRDRAQEYIELVQIERWADTMPDRLSGGQQQRVALARALVTSPDVLLMDEPLSNLDAKLRVEMREVIREIQQRVGITTVYVTHDQEEAMAVSDRIAVMRDGTVQHLGTPPELYHRPRNEYVSTFIGRSNTFTAELDGESLRIAGRAFPLPGRLYDPPASGRVRLSVRPEQLVIDERGDRGIPGTIVHSVFLGRTIQYAVDLEDGTQVEIVETSHFAQPLSPGTAVRVDVETSRINVFDEAGERNLLIGADEPAVAGEAVRT
ncbi:ABC transporter ATP-binding protein [Microbacterium sp. No. 7]|uniref:ABC transporter ATP-binding protein n=1 Tax=Microbacterium sp. No. 7 TaxID=1714373 RepID=UPI0006D0A445|nr:ABC transporter ATP-binding protein [Microbacterium sp. No. 7]ALJ18486.1 peptide ABC transporter substrate-binding protein [Microbacterium sp. No. 7]